MSIVVLNGDGTDYLDGEDGQRQLIMIKQYYEQVIVYGDAEYVYYNSRGGDDIIFGKAAEGIDSFYGDGLRLLLSYGGDDKIFGAKGAMRNELIGDARDLFSSSGGNDQIRGGADSDVNLIYGDFYDLSGVIGDLSYGGNDRLWGGEENTENYLYGDSWQIDGGVCGNDLLVAGGQSTINHMYGDAQTAGSQVSAGDDRLVSGGGTDNMWGDFEEYVNPANNFVNFGRDTFVFHSDNGSDTIRDFRQGEDKIEFSGIAGINEFSALQINILGGDSLINLSAGNTIHVIGVTSLQADDFIFT